jgi:carbon monoxide dehydrogenase subunit G
MPQIEITQHATAPPDVVWAVATDIGGSPATLSGVSAVQMLSEGEFGVATRWRESRRMMGREATEELWVTAVEPLRSYTVEADSSGVHYVSTFRFVPAGDGTDITLTFEGRAHHPVSRVLSVVTGRLMERGVRSALAKDVADLAAAAEQRARASGT